MGAVWSMDLAEKYPHLPWALLNKPFKVEALMVANVVLSAPMALQILGPEVARRALKFIANGTIRATPVNKILLEGEPLSPAVDGVCGAVQQAGQIAQPALAVAALLLTMMMSAQTLSAIAQQQQSTNSPTEAANAFRETLPSIIEASSFPMATIPQSLKIAFFVKSTCAGAWSSTSTGRSRYCGTVTMENKPPDRLKL
uniref:Uncharacterized protein n=1 Tax=Romanomermis culicivorax TaxID=13658 RepID=A0A915JJ44_ROMCU